MEERIMITTRGRYAIRVMIDLAENDQGDYIPLKDIADRQGISKKYLEIIVRDMVAGGLVTGLSGKGGGYRLTRRPEEYTIGEILDIMEGGMEAVACLGKDAPDCPRKGECKTLPLWREYDELQRSFFQSKKLSDLI